ncbi:MAG: glycine cleavage system protein H, partial [Nitrospinaceae bacterium]|nr:glycine cleavage system protein H [Nitrospinaceae bacterium]
PISGTVTAVNKDLEVRPEQVNDAPYGNGWIIEIEFSDDNGLEKLMSSEEYIERCNKEQG